jgi:UDP-N-acetylmuramoyl-L-alanyl-D-glutamate--2,6-diaminopimelate ligase
VKTDRFDREFVLTMPGLFNVENALAAIAVAYALRIPEEHIYTGLRKARSSGRMEYFANKAKDRIVIVDYAHNKLSFAKLYETVKAEFPGMKIVTVFGCPGGKAYLRRKDLGLLAGLHSDKVYLTAEDPGPEETRTISEDIAQYVRQNNANCELIDDREEAVRDAILTSEPGTVILITGKGNETRQKYGNKYVPVLSDVELTKKYLAELEDMA